MENGNHKANVYHLTSNTNYQFHKTVSIVKLYNHKKEEK